MINFIDRKKERIVNIHFSCTECSFPIELLSIDEENCIIEFKCLNKESHGKKKLCIKEYFDKIKNIKNENKYGFEDKCEIHCSAKNNFYSSFCFDCNQHLCKNCLKSRTHIMHNKSQIIEIQPRQEELEIIEEVLNRYKIKFENLKNEKKIKEAKYEILLYNEITKEKIIMDKRRNMNEMNKKKN